jgi:Asp-tRNA(Asn)/Glu-tRNA(Gln) amidotransferase A subunit family amidase
MRTTQSVGTWDDLPVGVLEDAIYEPSSDDLLDLLLDYGQHLYSRDKPASRVVMAAYRRIAHLEKKLETLIEQRDEARRDAVEAEAYATELEGRARTGPLPTVGVVIP